MRIKFPWVWRKEYDALRRVVLDHQGRLRALELVFQNPPWSRTPIPDGVHPPWLEPVKNDPEPPVVPLSVDEADLEAVIDERRRQAR